MNFLAHAFLSGDDQQLLVGNFIGDFVKGKAYESYPNRIATGIQLHRAIDGYTDNHPMTTKSKKLLRETYRHYAGVIVDVLYDHFLARNWQKYYSMSLKNYTLQTYSTIEQYGELLPERFKYVFSYMSRDNWLFNYSRLEGIDRALKGMARRTKFDSKMEYAINDIKSDYDVYQDHFEAFIPEIQLYVKDWLNENRKSI